MYNCIFCKIIAGEIPSKKLYEDENFIIINDIQPKAKIHLIAIPKKHYPVLEVMDENDVSALGKIFSKISLLREELGLKNGYRLVINQGEDAMQTVFHLHIHILGGEKLPF